MKRRVKIISRPKAQSGLDIRMNPGMGFNANQLSWPVMAGEFSQKDIETKGTIEPTDWDNANLEAEKGETVVTDLNNDGIPEHYKIGGKRHYDGGTPLNLPENSFIFSRDRGMKIKDEDIQKMFGKSFKKSGYTPADLAKTYDINKYRKVLADPDSDDLQRETAEMMITNYNLKLGKLALAQESLKGFPQGIPAISMPYIETMSINPAEFLQTQGQQEQPAADNIAKYGKEVKRKVRILGLPKAQGGLSVTKKQNIPQEAFNENRVIKRSDYTTEEDFVKARNDAYASSKGKAIYTQGADGKYYRVTTKPLVTDVNSNLAYMKQSFSDPNVAEAFKQKILQAYKQEGNLNNTVKSNLSYEQIENMPAEELVNQFIQLNERNLKTAAIIGNNYDCFDNATGKKLSTSKCKDLPYNSLDEVFKKVGVPLPENKGVVGLQQLTYIGYKDLLEDNKAGKITDKSLSEKLKPFSVDQLGVSDETIAKGQGRVSKADSIYTNTSAGQVAKIQGFDYGEELIPEEDIPGTKEEKEKVITHLEDSPRVPADAPWWLQDIIRVAGAAGDYAAAKKYLPWQATAQTYLPEGVFYDPNRELAASAEQANMLTQNLAAFTGPQALSSRASQIQGQSARQAADIMGRYNNLNVGTANQLEGQRAQILNAAAQQRAAQKTNLHDKNTVANQQFDNTKRGLLGNLRQTYSDALTNRWNTFNLNQLFGYNARPDIGGGIFFTDGRPVTPDTSTTKTALDKFREYREALPADVDNATIWNIAKTDLPGSTNSNIDPAYLEILQAMTAGKNV